MKQMPLYKKYENTKTIGVVTLCKWGWLEVLDIVEGYDIYIVACFNFGTGTGRQQIRRHKVCETSAGRQYFWKGRRRYYLDEIVRI